MEVTRVSLGHLDIVKMWHRTNLSELTQPWFGSANSGVSLTLRLTLAIQLTLLTLSLTFNLKS